MIFFVGLLPVAIAVAAFVIDVANGFEHRRHIQLQADAGALAAAQEFSGCFLDETAAHTEMESEALSYSGATHNAQIGSPDAQDRVQTRINAAGWSAGSYTAGDPCDVGYVDVKLTEEDSPPFFPFVGSQDYRGRARVRAFKLVQSSKLLPIAVPDPDPKVARALFVNEATGAVLAQTPLVRHGSAGGVALWDNEAAPVTVPITAAHVGVRIALGGATSTTCGDPLVTCYDTVSTNGLVHIRGWSRAGTGAPQAPLARSVNLLSEECPDAYFLSASVACSLGVEATVDFGGDPVVLGATVAATVGNQSYPLTYSPITGRWRVGAAIPVDPGAGPIEVGLTWSIARLADGTRCNGASCRGTIGPVQRTFSANPDRSGPIGLVQVAENGIAPADSFEACSSVQLTCSHNLVVKIGITGGLALSELDDPPVRLRVIGGSQNQSLDCDPGVSTLRDELAGGCAPSYTPNTGTACPSTPTELWSDPNPPATWNCVATQTGNATNQIAEGLNIRVLGQSKPTACPPERQNHWPDWEPGESRIVFVIVTPFGAFSGSGNTTVPVVRFAVFYVTGWTGQGSGFDNPCLAHGDEAPTNPAEIVGRFIKYVDIPNEGGAGEATCDFGAIDPCTAVLVE